MIEALTLKNFRKHKKLSLELDPQFNLLHGRNNSGKTTIFYAIEYCLFGSVRGFKKISQLAKFKNNSVGVELIFKGKNGADYKLQRMHELKGKNRSARGDFTLKKITSDGEEKYLLASDFGNREDELSLKLLEILGISKRFFETGLHFAQGEISDILRGDKKLDIVFGIKTATALAKIFKRRALDFEKEVESLDTFETIVEEAKKEKAEYQTKLKKKQEKENTLNLKIEKERNTAKQLQNFKESSNTISKAVKSVEKAKETVKETTIKVEMIQKEIKEHMEKLGKGKDIENKYSALTEELSKLNEKVVEKEKAIKTIQAKIQKSENKQVELKTLKKQKDELSKEKESLIKEHGTEEHLKKESKEIKKKETTIKKKIKEIENEQVELQEFFRTAERKKGNIKGILERRELNKDNQKCEYCGAPIDSEKISTEIEEYKKKLEELELKIENDEEKKKKLKEEIVKLREEEKVIYQKSLEITNLMDRINDLKNKIDTKFEKDLDQQLKELKTEVQTQTAELESYQKDLTSLMENQKEKQRECDKIESIIKRKEELNEKLNKTNEEKEIAEKMLSKEKENLLFTLGTITGEIKPYIKELNEEDQFFTELQTILDAIESFKDNPSLEAAIKLKEDFNELIITKISEKKSALSHLKEQMSQVTKDLEETKDQIKRLDKKIAANEKKVEILSFKKELSEKYRKYQGIFKETQEIIRNNVSSALEERILKFHNIMSTEEEFEHVYVDNEDYSLSVTPKGMGNNDIYPAWVYEGGGHKLLLGLAYKFSLSELIGKSSFLLIDEPTEFIDVSNRKSLLSNISSIAENTQILLITHQDVDKIVCNNKIKFEK